MSSTEFWEEEPQLYWAYRFSYEKKIEFEQKEEAEKIKYSSWLNGKTSEIAFSVVLNNIFSKDKKTYPDFKALFSNESCNQLKNDLMEKLEGVSDKDERGNIEFNHWARL